MVGRKIFFDKTTGNLGLLLYHFTPRNSRQNEASPLEFPKLVLHSLEIPRPISKTRGDFFITPVNSFSWPLDFPNFIQKFYVLGHPPSPPVYFFSEIAHSHSTLTVIFPVSDEWLIFYCRNLILCQKKKKILTQKAAFLSLL